MKFITQRGEKQEYRDIETGRTASLDEKKQKAFYMACYNVDRFRDFVFNTKFLDVFDID